MTPPLMMVLRTNSSFARRVAERRATDAANFAQQVRRLRCVLEQNSVSILVHRLFSAFAVSAPTEAYLAAFEARDIQETQLTLVSSKRAFSSRQGSS